MKKYFCDSCKMEVKRLNILEVPCHVYSMKGMVGYVDNDGNQISGKRDQIELCNKCWNTAHYAAVKSIGLSV